MHFKTLILAYLALFLISSLAFAQPNRTIDIDRIKACVQEGEESRVQEVKVLRVVDGDTFYAKDKMGNKVKYRLIGIDTPEFSHFGRPEEPYAQDATDFLKQLVISSDVDPVISSVVEISYDIQTKDKYNRDLVYLYLPDGTFVNAELVKAGWAQVSTISPNITHAHTFINLQRQARQKGRGIWSLDH